MRRDEIWNAVTLKARAIYQGAEYDVIGYTYKHLTNARESIILKDLRANSVIECPIGDVQIVATAQKMGVTENESKSTERIRFSPEVAEG